MARLAVVEFKSNSDAEQFREALKSPTGIFMQRLVDGNGTYDYLTDAAVLGMFARPTLYCECLPLDMTKDTVRGEKWGWSVCKKCAKPQKGHWQYPKDLMFEGTTIKERQLFVGMRM